MFCITIIITLKLLRGWDAGGVEVHDVDNCKFHNQLYSTNSLKVYPQNVNSADDQVWICLILFFHLKDCK